jgi:hypothetical protein
MNTSADLQFEISQPELEDDLSLADLSIGDSVEVKTKHRCYVIENRGNGQVLISGHPEYCPRPVLVKLNGSTSGGLLMKVGIIRRGMLLEFRHPVHGVIRTSPIQAIRLSEHKSNVSSWQPASRN